MPIEYVVVEGTVVDAETPSPHEAREAIAVRYLGPEGGRAFADQMDGDRSVLFTIHPDRWTSQDYSSDF
ncbi:hypothetical protein [Nocardia jinanensis]|uniref:Uncharacterized protein n=1 Tax=Nocardia jinanensis TaxID=382504 RepID=A0A917RK11_9NOCA|nr:hypothetical protein [Nocardia jinanensis]GGL10932.1 hypothetical protein GCM10011588_26800 [Nocardia jinanensis]